MDYNFKHRIFFRFLKNNDLYQKIIFQIKYQQSEYLLSKEYLYQIFDKLFVWSNTNEGYKYWYGVQLNFIRILITIDPNNIDYIKYYQLLLSFNVK